MDTEKLLIPNSTLDSISFFELSPKALVFAKSYVELTRHLQEIHDLYLVFMYNLHSMTDTYSLWNDETFRVNGSLSSSEQDFIAINALTSNILSSGKTLIDSMRSFVQEHYSETESARIQYDEFCKETYDSSFSYRLLIRLRDYTQHGHLAVNSDNGIYFFNLKLILDKAHYNHNKTLAQELKGLSDEILQKFDDIPRFFVSFTIAEYISQLLSIYNYFWELNISMINKRCDLFLEFASSMPENCICQENSANRFFIYEVLDSTAHVVDVDATAKNTYQNFAREAHDISLEYKNKWIRLKQSFRKSASTSFYD